MLVAEKRSSGNLAVGLGTRGNSTEDHEYERVQEDLRDKSAESYDGGSVSEQGVTGDVVVMQGRVGLCCGRGRLQSKTVRQAIKAGREDLVRIVDEER